MENNSKIDYIFRIIILFLFAAFLHYHIVDVRQRSYSKGFNDGQLKTYNYADSLIENGNIIVDIDMKMDANKKVDFIWKIRKK